MSYAIIYSLGMTLFHSLWQISLLALILVLVLRIFRVTSPEVRYRFSFFILILSLLTSCITFFIYYNGHKDDSGQIQALYQEYGPEIIGQLFQAASGEDISPSLLDRCLPLFVYFYIAGLFILGLRFSGSLVLLHTYKRKSILPVDPYFEREFEKLSLKLRIKNTPHILESLRIKIPVVIGYFKPLVIVPAGFFMQLPFNQVEAILLHELAHIKRKDFLFNIFQSFIEIVFFYHPLIYFISSHIRKERENCCDDTAVRYCKGSIEYIKALANMEELANGQLFSAVAFGTNRTKLIHRMKRLITQKPMKTKISDKIIAGTIILVGIFTIILTGAATLTNINHDSGRIMETNSIEDSSIRLHTAPLQGVHADTIIDFDSDRVVLFRENKKEEKERVEMSFKNGELVELIVGGEVIPKRKYKNYKDLIMSARTEVARASEEAEQAEKELEAIDAEEIRKEVEEALAEVHEYDQEEVRMEIEEARKEMNKIDKEEIREEIALAMEEARAELEEADIDIDSIQMIVNDALESVDWKEIEVEIEKAFKEAEMTEEEIGEALDGVHEAMEEIDWDGLSETIQIGIDAAITGIQSIDWEQIGETIGISLDITTDVLKGIHEGLEENIDIQADIDKAKKENANNRKKLEDLEKSMEEALEELEDN